MPTSDDGSDYDEEEEEDARTLLQIKRSRIDLERRYVFLCPTSLNKHFEVLPSQAKDSALVVFRCARNWIFPDPPAARRARTSAKVDTNFDKDKAVRRPSSRPGRSAASLRTALYKPQFSQDFLKWLETKEREECVFWYKPDKDLEKLSFFFEEKIDPLSEEPYRPLLLDPSWWRIRFDRRSARFMSNPAKIIENISQRSIAGLALKDREIDPIALQELIWQSNPTLEPIIKWPHAPSMSFLQRTVRAVDMEASQCHGYIDLSLASGLQSGTWQALCAVQNTPQRIGQWPLEPRTRLDALHHFWQVDAATCDRKRAFQLLGLSTIARTGSEAATAR